MAQKNYTEKILLITDAAKKVNSRNCGQVGTAYMYKFISAWVRVNAITH